MENGVSGAARGRGNHRSPKETVREGKGSPGKSRKRRKVPESPGIVMERHERNSMKVCQIFLKI